MARRPPARVRAEHDRWQPADRDPDIPVLSPRGRVAIARLERTRLWPGAAAEALDSLTRFVGDPMHRLWIPESGCGVSLCCPETPRLRQILNAVLRVLPPVDARLLRQRIASVDDLW